MFGHRVWSFFFLPYTLLFYWMATASMYLSSCYTYVVCGRLVKSRDVRALAGRLTRLWVFSAFSNITRSHEKMLSAHLHYHFLAIATSRGLLKPKHHHFLFGLFKVCFTYVRPIIGGKETKALVMKDPSIIRSRRPRGMKWTTTSFISLLFNRGFFKSGTWPSTIPFRAIVPLFLNVFLLSDHFFFRVNNSDRIVSTHT